MTSPDPQTSPSRRVLFSAQKNEGPFLLEWIAYHKIIGFTEIFIVSNDCDDGSDTLLDTLDAAGEITHVKQIVPEGIPPQTHAAQLAKDSGFFRDGDWVMWLDADEFLLPAEGGTVEDIIAAAEVAQASSVSIAWRFMGDSGHAQWPGRHISTAFTGAAPVWKGKSTQVKTLFRWSDAIEALDIHRPILAPDVTADTFRALNSAGTDMEPRFFDRAKRVPFNRINVEKQPYKLGRVLHFSIRTPDMFALKRQRGDGYYANPQEVQRDDDFYAAKNFNAREETGHHQHEAAVTQEMARLLQDPNTARAAESVAEILAAKLGQLA
ncbi:glycosyltransferase family 2 protein [Celeribacter naphthalenivorans]|uniref:glycosyltransferase family 2 protein n=1 Tax=Celeribacter naphthalenivorans TaxID=1614694 RepID=UPI001CFC27F5|nr:glycosyltransferase family 2 protein [Celeribacter naphthalenivorans]